MFVCVFAGVFVGFMMTSYSIEEFGGDVLTVSIVREDQLDSDHDFSVKLILSSSSTAVAGVCVFVCVCVYVFVGVSE